MNKSLPPSRRHSYQLGARFELDFVARLDEWRRRLPLIPNRSEAARVLLEKALSSEGFPPGSVSIPPEMKP